MAPTSRPTNTVHLLASTGFAPSGLENKSMMIPNFFYSDVHVRSTLFQETEQAVPTRKNIPQMTFAMSNLAAPPLLPTVTSSTQAQPTQLSAISPSPSTMLTSTMATTTAFASGLDITSLSVSSVSSMITPSSTSDYDLFRFASTATTSHSSRASSSPSDMSRAATPPNHPDTPAILLGCLLVFVIITLIGNLLSWCWIYRNRQRQYQQEYPWIHDEERNGFDSRSMSHVLQKSTAGQWNGANDGDMTEVSLASPVLNRRYPGYRSPILPTFANTLPNSILLATPHPSSLLFQAAPTISTATTAKAERSYTPSTPSIQDHSAPSNGRKLVVVNSAPEDNSSSDSESLIGPRKTDGEIPHSRRWKL